MAINIKQDKLSSGINITTIEDPKFKTNCITIRFITKMDAKTASAYALIPNVLISCNAKYKTRTEITTKLSELYGSGMSSNTRKIGDNQSIAITADFICDKYTLEGENVSGEVTDILIDCLFNPLLENEGFAKEEFNLRKQELLDTIDNQINEKRIYAFLRANQTIYKNEPSAIPSYGTKEGAKALTPQNTYQAYRNLLKTSYIEITLAGGQNLDGVKDKLVNAFSKIERSPEKFEYISYSPTKNEVAECSDELDVNQCKMVMAFKTQNKNYFANRLMQTMLGGTAFSKLFMNVREKYSLCYYCAANFIEAKGTLLVDSGVEMQNVPKAKEEIINQLNALSNGDFTDDEIKNAILSIAGDFKSNYDSIKDIGSWYFVQNLRKTNMTPEDAIKELNEVTRDQIIVAAKSFKLDTIYLMKNKEGNE